MKALVKFILLFQLVIISSAEGAEIMSEVTKEIERINTMRESLVSGVQGEVSPEIFKAVCKPVGQELKTLSKQLGVEIKQASEKYRNPNHKPTKLEVKVLESFSEDKGLVSLWKKSDEGIYYFRRINIQKACLNCHGSKSSRPKFIKKKYPNDRAFGFKVGELRGMYSIFISHKRDVKK